MAQISIIQKSECSKYDFGHSLLSPDFFLKDKIDAWNLLCKKSKYIVSDCFFHIKETTDLVDEISVCYDLTDAIQKFLNDGKNLKIIKSNKKIAKKDDFIISRLRYYLEEMAIVESDQRQQLFSTEFLVFREKAHNISTFSLFALCMTDTVQIILKRGQYGTGHPRFYNFLLENLPIPDFLFDIDMSIKTIIINALKKRTESKQLYQQAEQLLLEELGLVNYQPQHQLSFSTTKNDITEAQRFDSEYFQPKYFDIINKIEDYSGGFDVVKNQFKQNKALVKKDKSFYNYIEIGSVNPSNGEIVPSLLNTKDIPANGKRELFKNDLLISKVRPYRGAISFIDFEAKNLLGSGAFTVLQEKTGYKKEVLLLFLKTVFIKELLLRYNCGTSYPVIKDEDILNLKIPLIKPKVQTKIAEKITQSYQLRSESKELLELAKLKVEREIEKPLA
jgi:type I restriction enzyme S subunit